MRYSYDNFVRVYKKAKHEINKGVNLVSNMTSVMVASRYLCNYTKREVNLAAAYAVEIEHLVQPSHVHPDDLVSAKRCIGSNGRYAMPIRDWAYEG